MTPITTDPNRARRVAIVAGSPIVPALAAQLTQLGIDPVLVGDVDVDAADVQRSRYCDPRSLGRPMRALLSEQLGQAVEAVPFPTSPRGWDAVLRRVDVTVAAIDGPFLFLPWLDELNAAALRARAPWLIASAPIYEEVQVGPLYIPGETACHRCLEARLKSHAANIELDQEFERLGRALGRERSRFGFLPPAADIAAALAASEIARFFARDVAPRPLGTLIVFSTATLALEAHPVLPIPLCPACAPPAAYAEVTGGAA
jgi:bacteriocin biosynthesis cyclodehydratase domain-containing protein